MSDCFRHVVEISITACERSGRFCRSALNLIFLTSTHRSAPLPSTRVLARSAPFPLHSHLS